MSKKKDKKLKPLQKSSRKPVPDAKDKDQAISESDYQRLAVEFIENHLPAERERIRQNFHLKDERIMNQAKLIESLYMRLQKAETENEAYDRIINRQTVLVPSNN